MKKCLIVVDYQVDFVTGSLGFEKAVALEKPIADKISRYRAENADVIFTFDTHQSDYLSTNEGRNLPVVHCIEGTGGHDLYGTVADMKKAGDRCFNKPVFGSTQLFDYLRESDYDTIELCGVVSNICVISNAVLAKTALPEADIIVDSACVASNDDSLNDSALKVMQSLQIKVI
ncbi:MAG: isochorismatase family cysteine hydrolase [Ruminococcus sp.]|nr:isochorismatase family cysteine hydrolase [Ruminococcus sp.]